MLHRHLSHFSYLERRSECSKVMASEKRKDLHDLKSWDHDDHKADLGHQLKKLKQAGPSSGKAIRELSEVKWKKITSENLNLDYCILYQMSEADELMSKLESEIVYNTGRESQIQLYGKWHDIPRKQAAYGDDGLTYTFSRKTVVAKPWTPLLEQIRDNIQSVTGRKFNFVLVNRYKDGSDHIGEHRDDEKDLVRESPIASLSLGAARDFVLRHGDTRGRKKCRDIDNVSLKLEHGCLLMMNYPTNRYWYHSLPARKNVTGVRINLTFRDFVVKESGKNN